MSNAYKEYGKYLNSLTRRELIEWDKKVKKKTKTILEKAEERFNKKSDDKSLISNTLSFLESEITIDYIYNPDDILNKSKRKQKQFFDNFLKMCKEIYQQ